MQSLFSDFTVLLIIPERFNLVYNQLNHSLFSVPVLFILQYLLEIRGGQQPMIANFFILTGQKDHHDYSIFQYGRYISDSLQDKIREIFYFSALIFIFHTKIKRGTYFAITHDFIQLAYSKNSLCFMRVCHSDSM